MKSPINYEHVMILDGIMGLLYRTLGLTKMSIWLHTPNEKFENQCPCDLMKKVKSAQRLYVWLLENENETK